MQRVAPVLALVFLGALLAYLQPWWPRLVVVRQGGEGPPDIMLLHGEQATPAELLPYTRSIGFPAQGRILLPEAPEVMAPRNGLPGGRVWWDLDLTAYPRRGGRGVDLTSLEPRGLERAAKLVRSALGREEISEARPFILGGFSQGALVACEVAFNSNAPLSALVLLSGTYVDSTRWGWKAAGRRGLPVFIAHGRQDPIFPFEQAEKLAQQLARGQGEGHPGVDVTFVPFEGGHEITAEVQSELALFLARLRQAAWRKQAERGVDGLAAPASNVKEVRNFPDDLPDCASNAGRETPLESGLGPVGQRVTFTGTLSLEERRFCTGVFCESARCCNTCDIRFQLRGLGNPEATVVLARSVKVMDCEPSPSIERSVVATGVLVLDDLFFGPPQKPGFSLQDANLCVIGRPR